LLYRGSSIGIERLHQLVSHPRYRLALLPPFPEGGGISQATFGSSNIATNVVTPNVSWVGEGCRQVHACDCRSARNYQHPRAVDRFSAVWKIRESEVCDTDRILPSAIATATDVNNALSPSNTRRFLISVTKPVDEGCCLVQAVTLATRSAAPIVRRHVIAFLDEDPVIPRWW
jgi:hypothetical protein